MNKIETLASQLSEVAIQKKSLTIKEEALKDLLLSEMNKAGKDKESFGFGSISVGHRRSYIYSDVVTKLEEKVKIKKDEEVKLGVAEEKVTEYITFREAKTK